MKLPTIFTRKKKLYATTARRSRTLGLPEEMDYEQMSEPNMKLSRALLIVLVLHVVAVAGIVAFNTIKTREGFAPNPSAAPVAEQSASPAVMSSLPGLPNEVAKADAPAVGPKPATEKLPPALSTVKDSGKTYVVIKGDNPVRIARRFKVSEADLLALNQITDSRKLQINQKLRIPESKGAVKPKAD